MEKEIIMGIYKITSPSGKIYIGQSQNIEGRRTTYKNQSQCVQKQRKILNSLKKYGWDSHAFEIIEECEFEQLNIRERYWQDFYNVTGKNGLNCVLTRTDILPQRLSEETCKRISESKKGKKHTEEHKNKVKDFRESVDYYRGRKNTEESKKKMSDSKLLMYDKDKNPFFGKKHTEEAKQKMRERKIGTTQSDERRRKNAKYITIDVQTKEVFIGSRRAAIKLGVSSVFLDTIFRGERENITNLILLSEYDESKEYVIKDFDPDKLKNRSKKKSK